eukprot:TRINITY_DN2370_c0_g1_i1.p1 TRINITY_DN2370_c0_g1~~TRINITY_DN2370_c0_g1_i1.p1  ORF type:complete len:325 (-),score=89.45 TRINITY_DN2370_c0_g1_i1:15-989(-)
MTTEIDILNTSWETFQRVINPEPQVYLRNMHPQENFMISPRLPSFQELFDYKSPSPIKSSEEDSDSSFFDSFFSPESLNTIKLEAEMQDEMEKFEEKTTIIKRDVRQFIKREKEFERPSTIELNIKQKKIKLEQISSPNTTTQTNKIINNKSPSKPLLLSKKNVEISSPSSSKRSDVVRNIWFNNLQQILENTMVPNKRCLYKFENPVNSPWEDKDGLYIFEIHLLQVLCQKEAWNFKRYVDNHSKKAGEGQTFTLCSSIHKDEWELLDMKSNKFFKKARMININAFKEKNGFITKGKWKYIYNIFQKEFENCIINTFNTNHKK